MSILENILERIDKIKPDNKKIHLLAVTKNREASEIIPIIQQGITIIGENRIQEAIQKLPLLSSFIIERHFIGSLQSNKENKVLDFFDVIQSIESLDQLKSIHKKLQTRNITKKVFFQYNTSLEDSKHGLRSQEDLCAMVDFVCNNPYIQLEGLMTIGALSQDEKKVRDSFFQLACIKEKLIVQYPELSNLKLSMGMSNDFEWAIQEGSDMIRLGKILFT